MLLGMNSQSEKREQYIRLPFAYPGAKGDHLDKILPHLPYGKGYGEAFGGSGVVLFNREPSELEIFNDRYSGIVAFFRVVRDRQLYPLFMERINATVHSREEFIWCKRTWKDCTDDVERAARWYYTIRFAINGKVKSTFGRSKGIRFADRLHKSLPLFGPIHSRLHTVTLENLDWRDYLSDYDQTGFVHYLDPTYLDCYPGTYDYEMSVEDHKELVCRIPGLRGFVAVSTYEGPKTLEIYDKAGLWDDKIYWERTSTALNQGSNLETKETSNERTTVKEILWIRNFR